MGAAGYGDKDVENAKKRLQFHIRNKGLMDSITRQYRDLASYKASVSSLTDLLTSRAKHRHINLSPFTEARPVSENDRKTEETCHGLQRQMNKIRIHR